MSTNQTHDDIGRERGARKAIPRAARSVFVGGALLAVAASLLQPQLSHGILSLKGAKQSEVVTPGDDSTIKIGLVTALTGDLKPWGVDCMVGAKLAVEEFNKAGGLHGKSVQLLVEDSGSRPEQGKSAAEKLIAEGCIAVLGEIASGISAQMKEATTGRRVPQVMTGATRDNLTEGTRYLFRVTYTDKDQGPAMAKFAHDELRFRRVAILTDERQPYSVSLSQAFRATFRKLGGRIVDEESFSTGQTAFSGILAKVKAHRPEGIFCSGYFTEAGPIVRQAREMGISKRVAFLGGDGWDAKEILNSGGDAIVGSFFCNHYCNSDPSPRVQKLLEIWSGAHSGAKPVTACGPLGYDAAGLTLDALKRATSPTKEALRRALDSTVGYKGATGNVTLAGYHGNPPKRVVVVKLTDDILNSQAFVRAYEYSQLLPTGKRASR